MLTLGETKAGTSKWVTVNLGNDSMEVEVRSPTYKELVEDVFGGTEARLKRCIVNWRGVNDPEGNEVPFSWPNVERLASAFPAFVTAMVVAVDQVYFGEPGERSKN
jgi:hypothetical protein